MIQQGLYALVAVRGAAQHRGQGAGEAADAQGVHDFFLGQLFATQEFFHEIVVLLGSRFHHLLG